MKIARCTPSRGLIHSRTEEAAEEARRWAMERGHEWRSFYSHDKPIPGCFNAVCQAAYSWGADLVWILEEDVRPRRFVFADMYNAISRGSDVAVVDYPMDDPETGKLSWGTVRDGAGNVAWCRTGCILFKRECLEAMPQPWFTLCGRLFKDGVVTWESEPIDGYGADVGFTHGLTQLGFVIAEIEISCQHLRVIERGAVGTNNGWHSIQPLPEPEKPTFPPPRRKQ